MKSRLFPIVEGDTVCVVGGGPGGASCARALKQEARRQGRELHVVLYEQKRFKERRQHNQCIGLLSPPLETILLEHLGLRFPAGLARKVMTGYCLHSDHTDLLLKGEEEGVTYAVGRPDFDEFMFDQAVEAGVKINHDRVTGLEFSEESVLVYSEGRNCKAAAVVGAFGLDEGTADIFMDATPYRKPDFLNTIITKIFPGREFMEQAGSTVHAFLPSMKGVEFGAVTPKFDHLSINIAGRRVTSRAMLNFLRSAPVQRFLPPKQWREKPLNYYKGKFPIAPARHFFGDRYVMIGDAAGLMRPFKGKGINSACLTGIYAAHCILRHGVSAQAFQHYLKDCEELTADLWYGRAARVLTNIFTRWGLMNPLLQIAARDPELRACLFHCVSGHKPYKQILPKMITARRAVSFAGALARFITRSVWNSRG